MYIQSGKLLLGLLLLAAVYGCTIPRPIAERRESIPAEAYFKEGGSDSAALGDLPVRQFFQDSVLLALIDTALVYNFDLLIARERVQMAQGMFFANSALGRPTLDAAINGQFDRYGFFTMNGIGNYDMNKSPNVTPAMRVPEFVPDLLAGLRSRWELDIWGRFKNMRSAAAEKLMSEKEMLQWAQTQLVATLASRYYQLMALRYEEEVILRNIRLQENALEVVKALKAGGRATELAVQQFEAQVFRTRALRFGILQMIAEAENTINFLCGRYPRALPGGTPIMLQQLPTSLKGGLPAGLLQRRPDIRAGLNLLTAAYAETEVARKAFLPSVTITPYVGLQGFRLPAFFNAESIATGIAGNISAPLLQRRQIRGQYAVSNAQLETAWITYRKQLRSAVMEVQTSLQAIANLDNQFADKQRELTVLRTALTTANDLYTNGYANYLEIITAQQSLLEADLELVKIKQAQMEQLVLLYRNTGGGWR